MQSIEIESKSIGLKIIILIKVLVPVQNYKVGVISDQFSDDIFAVGDNLNSTDDSNRIGVLRNVGNVFMIVLVLFYSLYLLSYSRKVCS